MAFSGTISQTTFTTAKVVENAFRRCKIAPQLITPEYVDVAKDQLFLFLSELLNRGAPLWCVEKQLYPLYEGVAQVTTDEGTVDVTHVNLRTLQELDGTETTSSTVRALQFDSETIVSAVGILWSATSVPLAFESSDDGSTWTTLQSATPDEASGEWSWFDMSNQAATEYFRVRATTGTLSYDSIYFGNNPSETPVSRLNKDQFISLPDKSRQSARPVQYWFDRSERQPSLHLWPVPNAEATERQLVVWRKRHIMDVGSMSQEIEAPQRWYECIVANLAAKLALEIVEVDPALIELLDAKADAALRLAGAEERDKSPVMISPNISMYTR